MAGPCTVAVVRSWWAAALLGPFLFAGLMRFSFADESLTPRQTQGQALFARTCVYCHDQRGWGTRDIGARLGTAKALIAQRNDLSDSYIRLVLRHGIGNMPAFTPTDLSTEQIEAIVAYLTRNNAAP